jgi:hypothetical protein
MASRAPSMACGMVCLYPSHAASREGEKAGVSARGILLSFMLNQEETMTCESVKSMRMPLRGLPVDAGVDASHGHSQRCREIECCLHDGNDGMVAKERSIKIRWPT